jgi:hypothetical protein
LVSFLLAFSPISHMHSSSPHSCYMPFLDLVILNIPGEQYKVWGPTLCSFLQPPVTSLGMICKSWPKHHCPSLNPAMVSKMLRQNPIGYFLILQRTSLLSCHVHYWPCGKVL